MVVENYRAGNRTTNLSRFRSLRQERINSGEWGFMATVPYNILDEATKEAIQARDLVISRNNELRDQGEGPRHQLRFRTSKEAQQTIAIRQQNCVKGLFFYPRILHTRAMIAVDPAHPRRKPAASRPPFHPEHRKTNHNWPNVDGTVSRDSKLRYDRKLRRWIFVWCYEKPRVVPRDDQARVISAVSLDPGVRTFQTWYSPSHGCGEIGSGDAQKLVRLCFRLDDLVSRTAQAPARRRTSCDARRRRCVSVCAIS